MEMSANQTKGRERERKEKRKNKKEEAHQLLYRVWSWFILFDVIQ